MHSHKRGTVWAQNTTSRNVTDINPCEWRAASRLLDGWPIVRRGFIGVKIVGSGGRIRAKCRSWELFASSSGYDLKSV